MQITGKTFRDTEVDIDGVEFVECTFENVVFNYAGGPIGFKGCTIISYSFRLTGHLGAGLESLRKFHHADSPKAVKRMVDAVSGFLRRKDPAQTFMIN